MPLSRRHLMGVLLIVSLLVAAMSLRLALEWRQALRDIDSMIVSPAILPEEFHVDNPSEPFVAPEESPVDSNEPTPVSQPTAINNFGQPSINRTPLATDTVQLTEEPFVPSSDRPLNILLLGTDARPADTEPTRTDAIVLVHLDRQTGNVSMLSLPRDLWVTYPDGGEGRINAAYAIGERRFGAGGGAALAMSTVERLLGVPVDHYVLINFEGFRTLIDELGGITVDVPQAIYDPAYPTEDYGTMEVFFEAGSQHFDSDQALIYARTRHADSDFGRNQRQQQVLMAIFSQIRDRGVLSQLTSVDDYTRALRGYVQTDINRNQMLELGMFGRHVDTSDIQRYAIDSTMIIELREPATFAAEPRALRRVVSQFTGEVLSQAGGE